MASRDRIPGASPRRRHRGEPAVVDVMLPASRLAPKQARDALAELSADLQPATLEDARLLVSELVTNSVRHAASGRDARVRFRAEARPGRLRVEVTDWGPGFEAMVAKPALADQEGGFGLYLVHRLAHRWGVERGRTMLVWFELDDDARPPPDPAATP